MTRELPRIVYILFILNACYYLSLGFPGGPVIKNLSANAGDTGSIPGLGRFPEEGNGNPLQFSCLGIPMDRGAWRAIVHMVEKGLDMICSPCSYENPPLLMSPLMSIAN